MKARLIRQGTLVTPSDIFTADILILGEKIASIGTNLDSAGAEVFLAEGKLVFPGGVDVHTHFDLPMFGTVSSDDHYTGHKAAAFGGTTTVIDFVSQDYPSLKQCIDAWHAKADPKAAIDFGFHMNITHLTQQVEQELKTLEEEGITSLKVFTAYNNRLRLEDGDIFRLLRIARNLGYLTMLHAENGDVIDLLVSEAIADGKTSPIMHARTRPDWGAVEAALRGTALAATAGAPLYLVHMNTAGEVDQLRYARSKGVQVFGETCPQYLFFTEDVLNRPDAAKWICSPPLRTQADQQGLWEGLNDGTIQVIGTDHCPFFYDGSRPILYEGMPVSIPGKELGSRGFHLVPNGVPGVGDRLPVLWTYGVGMKKITPQQFVALTSTNPARLFGLYPRKGCLAPGADADLVIWDPHKKIKYGVEWAQHRTDYNLYEGWQLTGYPEAVFLRGQPIVQNNQWLGHAGMGNYLFRRQFSREM